ncbi:MAG: GntR family transcriptional regulator [Micrococcales bacterium]|nr:MAG: GntR family transcriptional regulator [Micrococcales bacterium]PIE27082.1 MAG: GntR family transcriptional regulator [Micrococcales bacterium]
MEFDTSRPIWLQLVSEFQRRIVVGEWPVGERIGGVRELAAELSVNPNTVQRALAELERDGLCRSERTAGRFVTDDPQRVASLRHRLATDAVDAFVETARGYFLTLDEATSLIQERWTTNGSHNLAVGAGER